ncbi:MAG: hypothetical protein ACREYC_16835 [Gammaproteobacteria bacterium]
MRLFRVGALALVVGFLSGCGPMLAMALVGPGKAATPDDTGFFRSHEGLASTGDPAFPNLPDLYYLSPQIRMSAYKNVVVPDFTSMTNDMSKLSGLQIRQYKSIKQDLPDQLVNTLDGSAFPRMSRTTDRFDAKDTSALMKVHADAILMGNIKELVSVGGENEAGLTALQIEYKLVDVKTGEEVLKAISRNTTDLDKVAMPQVRVLTALLNKAKGTSNARN